MWPEVLLVSVQTSTRLLALSNAYLCTLRAPELLPGVAVIWPDAMQSSDLGRETNRTFLGIQ